MLVNLLLAALVSGLVTFAVVRGVMPLWWRTRAYISACTECGVLPPPPTPRGLAFLRAMSWLLTFIQVGKVRIIGFENTKVPGPRLIAPNHGHSVDPAQFSRVFDEPLRYMAARGVFTFGGGLGSLIVGPTGAFAADLTPGKGGPAREAAVHVLATGQSLVMFPEGWAYMNGVIGPFKKGAVRIVKEAAARLGSEAFLIPTYMRYGRYPGSWILKFPPPVQYLIVMLMWPVYRRGLTIVFGKAISASSLPDDDAEATEMLRQAVIALDPVRSN